MSDQFLWWHNEASVQKMFDFYNIKLVLKANIWQSIGNVILGKPSKPAVQCARIVFAICLLPLFKEFIKYLL